MDSQCLERFRETPCFACREYRDNNGEPRCDNNVLCFPIERCGKYSREAGSDDNLGEDNG